MAGCQYIFTYSVEAVWVRFLSSVDVCRVSALAASVGRLSSRRASAHDPVSQQPTQRADIRCTKPPTLKAVCPNRGRGCPWAAPIRVHMLCQFLANFSSRAVVSSCRREDTRFLKQQNQGLRDSLRPTTTRDNPAESTESPLDPSGDGQGARRRHRHQRDGVGSRTQKRL